MNIKARKKKEIPANPVAVVTGHYIEHCRSYKQLDEYWIYNDIMLSTYLNLNADIIHISIMLPFYLLI